MYYRIVSAIVFTEFMYLCMAVMTPCNAVICLRGFDLLILDLAVLEALILESRLKESTTTATAEVVGSVRGHIDKVLFPDNRFYNKSQILCNRVTKGLSDNLTRILNCKLDLEILVPVGIYLEFTFTYPLCVIFINVLNLKFVRNVEFFQSCQD